MKTPEKSDLVNSDVRSGFTLIELLVVVKIL
jgi:type II secretory pathway pseudopilin PulG